MGRDRCFSVHSQDTETFQSLIQRAIARVKPFASSNMPIAFHRWQRQGLCNTSTLMSWSPFLSVCVAISVSLLACSVAKSISNCRSQKSSSSCQLQELCQHLEQTDQAIPSDLRRIAKEPNRAKAAECLNLFGILLASLCRKCKKEHAAYEGPRWSRSRVEDHGC